MRTQLATTQSVHAQVRGFDELFEVLPLNERVCDPDPAAGECVPERLVEPERLDVRDGRAREQPLVFLRLPPPHSWVWLYFIDNMPVDEDRNFRSEGDRGLGL